MSREAQDAIRLCAAALARDLGELTTDEIRCWSDRELADVLATLEESIRPLRKEHDRRADAEWMHEWVKAHG